MKTMQQRLHKVTKLIILSGNTSTVGALAFVSYLSPFLLVFARSSEITHAHRAQRESKGTKTEGLKTDNALRTANLQFSSVRSHWWS